MTRLNDTGPRAGRPLSILRDDRGPEPGTGLEPRRHGDLEPAWRVDPAPDPDEAGALRERLRESAADLRRLGSEYDNYRKRVHRDRRSVGQVAVANVLSGLLPVLDAIDQARRHGEVTGGFQRVAELLETELAGLGLRSYGTAGDPFDPALHEALSCTFSDRVERSTCTVILRPGYRVGDQLLRPAQAEVTAPPPG